MITFGTATLRKEANRMSTKERYLAEIEAAISRAKSWREIVTVTAEDGSEAYAYPKPGGRIAWGINAAETYVNVLRGIRKPDGTDEAES